MHLPNLRFPLFFQVAHTSSLDSRVPVSSLLSAHHLHLHPGSTTNTVDHANALSFPHPTTSNPPRLSSLDEPFIAIAPMDPTTLVTFLFKAPPQVRTVELLGSWDNFHRPYVMHHDRRRGHGFWSGCFHFDRIVFDGDRAQWIKPRSGGLKQGGTYWYFYRLNDAVEAFDDSMQCTKACPLLPGQTVNVIDIPVEVAQPPSRPRSATIDVAGELAGLQRTHTLDPGDKWAALEPPPVSKVHERCISDLALNGRLETKPVSFRENASPPVSPVSRQERPDLSISRQRTADDGSSIRPRSGWSSMPPSRGGNSSIFDAYVDSRCDPDDVSLSAFPMPQPSLTDERPRTRNGGHAHHAFDFGFDAASSRHSMSRTGDDHFDGTSYLLEPADSPPQSAYGSLDWRFTVTSEYYSVHEQSNEHLDRNTDNAPGHRHSHDDPSNDAPLCSPTFSAATISSQGGGANTPFRLSDGYPPPTHASPPPADLDHLTIRLRHLGSEDSAGSLASHISSVDSQSPRDDASRHVASHYALPDATPTPSKASSVGFGGAGSFADEIFSELGYLGASIA